MVYKNDFAIMSLPKTRIQQLKTTLLSKVREPSLEAHDEAVRLNCLSEFAEFVSFIVDNNDHNNDDNNLG